MQGEVSSELLKRPLLKPPQRVQHQDSLSSESLLREKGLFAEQVRTEEFIELRKHLPLEMFATRRFN